MNAKIQIATLALATLASASYQEVAPAHDNVPAPPQFAQEAYYQYQPTDDHYG
ncbi:hypothetical protein GGF46_005286, partial [Coemansia sp. RSA 552]